MRNPSEPITTEYHNSSAIEGARVMLRPDGCSGLSTEPLQQHSFLLPVKVAHE